MNKIQEKAVKTFANLAYGQFETDKITVTVAVKIAEEWLALAELEAAKRRALRNDISTNMGKITDTFDRTKHTHHFANLWVE